MVFNGETLLRMSPIEDMLQGKVRHLGVTYGLGEAGYDIRIKQSIYFRTTDTKRVVNVDGAERSQPGNFTIASAIEKFTMPSQLVGIVHDKSSWARRGLSVFNTVIEPGWTGYLTLELVFHGYGDLFIPAGSGIAQVVFSSVSNPAQYTGRYQNQKDEPVPAIHAENS